MPRGSFINSETPLPFSIRTLAERLDRATARLDADASEVPRVSAMSNALGKINGIVKNDLQRLRQMGVSPDGYNQIIDYHPPARA